MCEVLLWHILDCGPQCSYFARVVLPAPSKVADGAVMAIRDNGDCSCVVTLFCVGVLTVLAQGIIFGYVVCVETLVYWAVVCFHGSGVGIGTTLGDGATVGLGFS